MCGNSKPVKELQIFAMATDPIYIGTGGYTIGRVDNTIVRDPITNIPKIPGNSLAGTWRYYETLEALKDLKDKLPNWDDIKNETGNTIGEKLENYNWKHLNNNSPENWKGFIGNQVIKITCAGQDNVPQEELANSPCATNPEGKTGHCGHCIVCKGFGFSKKDISWQGMIFFSDLNILLFPVFTMIGTKWITTVRKLKEISINGLTEPTDNKVLTKNGDEGYINLGWIYLEVDNTHTFNSLKTEFNFDNFQLNDKDIVIVPEELFSHIVNSNLEVRTSVSIDPITGAAKERALFTSEAIPRGTIFYGKIRIFDKSGLEGIENKLSPLPKADLLEKALRESKHFYETLGIGGMTTRGFGRMKVYILGGNNTQADKKNNNTAEEKDEQSTNK